MRRVAAIVLALSFPPAIGAQSPPEHALPREPPLRRWLDVQSVTLETRYRFIRDSENVLLSDQLQYKDSLRVRVNFDPEKRYTLSAGYFTGGNFQGGWDNWGIGNHTSFEARDHYLKQLYVSAAPVAGFLLQYGGLYLARGESDELITYDNDGYLVGGRVMVRRPDALYLDEIIVTRGTIGPQDTPSLSKRWKLTGDPNYTQVVGVKHVNELTAGSLEFDRHSGSSILRVAVTRRFERSAPVGLIRYEQYWRVDPDPAAGFGLWAEAPLVWRMRAQGGYVTVDQRYGGWNADRVQIGRHVFLYVARPLHGPLSASIYMAYALRAPYTQSIGRRFDAAISYDVLHDLRRTGIF